jgi:hypothetical protein
MRSSSCQNATDDDEKREKVGKCPSVREVGRSPGDKLIRPECHVMSHSSIIHIQYRVIHTVDTRISTISLSLACGHKKEFLDKVSYMLVHHDLLCVRRGTVTRQPDRLCWQLARAMSTVLEIGSSLQAGTGKRDRKSRYDVSFSSRLFDRFGWLPFDSLKDTIVVQPFIRFVHSYFGPQIQIQTR